MNSFTIRDMQNMSGIKAHTLRVWEHRYGILLPKRKESRHRVYNNEDLKQILRVAYLYHRGHKISRIATYGQEEIRRLTLQFPDRASLIEAFINQFIETSIDFDEAEFNHIFDRLVVNVGFEEAIPKVIYPMLEKLGLLWMTNNVIPAQEHFVSNIISRKIQTATWGLPRIAQGTSQRKVLIYSPAGERHELPLLFMQYQLKKHKISSVYLGDNEKLETIRLYLQQQPFTHIYFHLITYLNDINLEDYVKSLCEGFPGQQVVISGKITIELNYTAPNLQILRSLEEVLAFGRGEL